MIELFPFVSLSLLFIYISLSDIKRSKLDFLTVFDVFYTFAYILTPLHIIYLGENYVSSGHLGVYSSINVGSVTSILVVIIFYLTLRTTYVKFSPNFNNTNIRMENHSGYIFLSTMFIFLSIIGIVGYTSVSGESPLAFLKIPIRFVWAALMLLIPVAIIRKDKLSIILLISASTISVISYGILQDRTRIVIAAIVFVCVIYSISSRAGRWILAISSITVPAFLVSAGSRSGQGQFITDFNGITDAYSSVIREGSHAYMSLETSLQHPESDTLIGIQDVIIGPLHLLPQRLIGVDFPGTITHWNTYLITGNYESVVLPGIVGYSWYSGIYIGIIAIPILYSLFGKLISEFLNSMEDNLANNVVYYTFAALWGFSFVRRDRKSVV